MTDASKIKSEIVTFKVDGSLLEAMKGIPNRSEFIRSAVLAALDSSCPMCNGTGILTPNQKRHYEELSKDHTIEECKECHETHIVCLRKRTDGQRASAR
jgi:metal-responsive CopG/Arc/MetJ family transcriptional regulator